MKVNYSTSKQLQKSTEHFFNIKFYTFLSQPDSGSDIFYGWGRKRSGFNAVRLSKKYHTPYVLLEDGFIRSVGLGVDGSPSFSLVEDDKGIYYDATEPSRLEIILNTYDFISDKTLMSTARKAIALIKKYYISKYNHAPVIDERFCIKYKIMETNKVKKILIITQTSGDASLEYGLAGKCTTEEIIDDALRENPDAFIYIKIHPDVLSGKKKSDINVNAIPKSCMLIDEEVNPISLLEYMDKVYTKTSGMGMEALILGKEVICYGIPYYAGWGLTKDKQTSDRRTRKISMEELFAGAYILYARYYNPYSEKKSDIIDTIQSIIKYRDLYQQNEGKLYFFGFTWWKRQFVKSFFPALRKNSIIFCTTLENAMHKGLDEHSKILIWGKKIFPELKTYAKEQNIPLLGVEDGFIRSVSLGSDLTKAYSLVIDNRGIYFDPRQESDLEQLLNTYIFDEALLKRAKKLQHYLIAHKISKYNIYKDGQYILENLKIGQKVVVVPGQVEDDASIIYGANGMSNLELLKKVKVNASDAYIIYKPHPDVLVGNRRGKIDKKVALKYCNAVIEDISLDSVLELAHEVHTMTSLVGFEALVRGKKVYTYGLPFYAGWGLTIDERNTSRRIVNRSLEELIATVFILYPRYIHPKTNKFCEIEVLLEEIDKEKKRYNNDILYRMIIVSRNFVSRKIQLIIKVLMNE